MLHAALISTDFETKKLLVRLGLAAAIASYLIWLTRIQLKTIREAFAKKWQMDMADVKLLYAGRRRKLGSVLMWLMAGPLFLMGVMAIVMTIGADANDIRLMLLVELYECPLALVMMGLYLLLTPSRDIAWALRLKSLRPADFPFPPALLDFEQALNAPPPRFYGLRIAGFVLLILAGTLICAEITCRAQIDRHLPSTTTVTHRVVPPA